MGDFTPSYFSYGKYVTEKDTSFFMTNFKKKKLLVW